MEIYLNYFSSDLSGSKNKMTAAITGNNKPIKNQVVPFLPMRLANLEVIKGILNSINIPKLKNNTAPICKKKY
jgi:hypothetical protein